MSFREKTSWIAMVSILGIYGLFFSWAIRSGPHFGRVDLGLLAATVVALAIVQVALTAAAAMFAPRDAQAPRDERDRLIAVRATRVAYAGLLTSVLVVCFFEAVQPPIVFNANALLFLVVAVEVLRYACQIVQYRRHS